MASYVFLSNPEVLDSVEELVVTFTKKYDVQKTLCNRIVISSLEAISNSINHGNGGDLDKKISFSLEKKDESIVVIVEDEGKGFDYLNIPDPTLPENILKPDGRGVFIMKKLSDMLVFNEQGNRVELYFNI